MWDVLSNQANAVCGGLDYQTRPESSLPGEPAAHWESHSSKSAETITLCLAQSPYVLQQNPALLHQLATGSPLRHHMPLLPILTNPRALQALIQIEKGLQILSREVPGLEPCLWCPVRPHGPEEFPKPGPEDRVTEQILCSPPAVLQLLHALANALLLSFCYPVLIVLMPSLKTAISKSWSI